MQVMPKRNIFRVSAAADADNANKVSGGVQTSLGFTLVNNTSGLVAYGPEEAAGTVNAEDALGNAFTYTRYAGPIDVPLAIALAYCRNGLAEPMIEPVTASPTTGEIPEVWMAGTISGETNIPITQIPGIASTPGPTVATGAVALPDEAWVIDNNA